jgi:hypothetical protein
MSYIRYNEPLRFFKGVSSSYVFPSYSAPDEEGNYTEFIEDYGDKYDNKVVLADLICRIVEKETDTKFATKMANALARHLGCNNQLREHPITGDEWSKEVMKIKKDIDKDPTYREFLKTIGWKKQDKTKK